MNMKFTSGFFACLFTLLAGCGGGSAGTTAEASGQGGSPQPAKPQFSISGRLYSPDCTARDEPYAGLTVLMHQENGALLQTLQTGPDGKLTAEWPSAARHLTVVHRDSATAMYRLRTYMNVSAADFGTIYYLDRSDNLKARCQCKTVSVDRQDLQKSMPEYDLTLDIDKNAVITKAKPVQILRLCQDNSGRFGRLYAWLEARNSVQRISSPAYLAEFDLNSASDQSMLTMRMQDFRQVGRLITNTTRRSSVWFETGVFTTGGNVFAGDRYFGGDQFRLLDLPGGHTYLSATHRESFNGKLAIASSHGNYQFFERKLLTAASTAHGFDIDQFTDFRIDFDMQSFYHWFNGAKTTALPYTFSSDGATRQLLWVNLRSREYKYEWTLLAPANGQFVPLELPAGVVEAISGDKLYEISFGVAAYLRAKDYQQHLQFMAELSKDPAAYGKNPALVDYQSQTITASDLK